MRILSVFNAGVDTDRFLVQDGTGAVKFRTGAEVAADIGAANIAASQLKHTVKAAVALTKGQAVYVSGADGTNMLVSKASNATESMSTKTMGLIDRNLAINDMGDVITEGLLSGLDTSTATIGDPVWLGVDGNLIYGLANKPLSPAHLVFIGIVTRVNLNNGEIFVKVQNGFELGELHDVLITGTPVDKAVIQYDSASGLWKNSAYAGVLASGATTQILRGDGSLYTFPLAISSPSTGQVLKYNGTSWVNDSDAGITGSLTTNYLPKATGATTLGDSTIRTDAAGNIGINVTPSAWSGVGRSLELASSSFITTQGQYFYTGSNFYFNGTNEIRKSNGFATSYAQQLGQHEWSTAPNGTAGDVLTFTQRARITVTGNFIINNSASDSGEKLQVTGDAIIKSSTNTILKINSNGGNAILDFITNAGTQRIIGGLGGSNNIDFYTNSVQRMKLDASGNLGLGVTPSAWASGYKALQVLNLSLFGTSSLDLNLGSNVFVDSVGYKYIGNGFASLYNQYLGKHYWNTAANNTSGAGNAISFTQAMTLDASGRLGIGTTSPSYRFHALATAQGSAIPIGLFENNKVDFSNGIVLDLKFTNSQTYNGGEVSAFLRAINGSTTVAYIGSFGNAYFANNLLIGSTTDSGERLQVTGTAKITGATTIGGGGSATSQLDVTSNSSANGITLRNRTGNDYAFFNWRSFDGTELLAESYIQRTAANTATLRHTINNGSGVANYLTIASTGAATFSSSVTAASGIITGNLTVDTNTLFVDATNNSVGIGTVNPLVQLDVNGAINLASGFSLTWGGAYGANIPTIASVSGTGSYMAFYPAGSTSGASMRITSGGDVGIGMTPSYKLDVTGSARVSDALGVGVSTFNASAKLQIDSTTQGFLPPRMTAAQRTAIATPPEGLIVFQSDGVVGLYLYVNSAWKSLAIVN